ncbi:MAG: 7-carboxy-7-deazaguanine synthase QueE [Calditrichaeota bacterium]|nr:MAG: 7-carboxy-7-deazaguanine synthase QueE [Calditrichota bacterium]
MLISEIFYSIQGEGILSGTPSLFIRTSGCNLRCNWCDTDYASWNPQGEEKTIGSLNEFIVSHPATHIVLTGGEPMIAKDVSTLCSFVSDLGKHLTIETAGTVAPNGIKCSLASLSPKLSNSTPDSRVSENWQKRHERDRINLGFLRLWIDNYEYQLKFVISSREDVPEILELLKLLDRDIPNEKVLLMPEGVTKEQLEEKKQFVSELCKEYGFRYCDRLHIALYGNKRGT